MGAALRSAGHVISPLLEEAWGAVGGPQGEFREELACSHCLPSEGEEVIPKLSEWELVRLRGEGKRQQE